MNKFNDFNLDIELNKITTDKYEQLKGDMEFIRNGVYQCYKKPINVDFSKIVNLADPENQYDAVNLRYFDENLNSIKCVIDKLKDRIENIDLNPETSKWCRDVEEKFDQFEALFCTIITLIDDIIYGIEKQNSNYSMLGQEEVKLTKNNITGYKFLYECNDNQVLVAIIKQSDKLITFTYEAKYDNFDILLDSAQSILYNFELVKDKVNYNSELENIKTNSISYKGTDTVDGTREYEISNYHYTIKYTIPNNFIIHNFNNTYGNYYEKDRDYNSEIQIKTSINNLNIYESINKKGSGIEYDIERIKKNDNNSDIKVEIDKGKIKDSYIYRVTYNYNNEYLDKIEKKELLYILVPLDNNHTFKVTIESVDKSISKDLIDSIDIVSKEKYSQNIILNYENNYVVNDMKYMLNTYDKYINLKLYTPKVYSELDYRSNNNEYRYFGYDYDSKKGVYNTNISYYVSSLCKNDASSVKDNYNTYKNVKVTFDGNKKYHDRSFNSYTISYQLNNITKYEKQLV